MELFSIPSAAGIIVKKAENENYVLIQERWKLGKESENGRKRADCYAICR